jgi:choline dehydrogenase-like flavoprotein
MLPAPASKSENYDVVVLGAGYAGLMAALRLGRRRLGLRVALINAKKQFVERVRLQEAMVAPVTPRIASLSAFWQRRPSPHPRARFRSTRRGTGSTSRLMDRPARCRRFWLRAGPRWPHCARRILSHAETPCGLESHFNSLGKMPLDLTIQYVYLSVAA